MGKSKPSNRPTNSSHDREEGSDDIDLFLEAVERVSVSDIKRHKSSDGLKSSASKARGRGNSSGAVRQSIDLHGMTIDQARARVSQGIERLRDQGHGTVHLKVITGKGLHSPDGRSVLADAIHSYVVNAYGSEIQTIDENPSNVTIGGVAIRGHFDVVLKFK
jgi:DNA-nicking Smr family endonuclease